MIIKVSGFQSFLQDNDYFKNYNNNFIDSINENFKYKLEWTSLDDYDCDLKLIFIASGGSEGLFLKEFSRLKPPYIFLTSGDNNSLAATLEIMTYLRLHNLDGEILHGGVKYIQERIELLCCKEKIRKALDNKNFGVVGHPSDWLISSVPDYTLVKKTFGVNLIDIPLDEVVDNFNKIVLPNNMLEANGFNKDEVINACKVLDSLEAIKNKYELSGLTIRCFDLLSRIKSTGCLALAKLNEKKITATCEGDIAAMLSMAIAGSLVDGRVFQANPSRIDVENNRIVFAHCTIPFNMLKDFKYDTHFESGLGVAIKGYLHEEDVTVFRLSSNLKDYFVSEGKIIRNLEEANLCRTQIEVELDDASSLLHKPCGNHHIIIYGKHKKAIEEFLKNIG